MLQLDCLKELSRPFGYTKTQIKELFLEANALGIEIIPMFNHLAHAASTRAIGGKHVVLDHPRLEYLLNNISRDIVIADWKYFKRNETWRSSITFHENGFDVLCCPWGKPDVIAEAVQTTKD